MPKSVAIIVVTLSIVFFIVGGLLVWNGLFSTNAYALSAGIIGSVASIIGLLTFASPRLTSKDILSVEGDLIQKLALATKSVEEYEERISHNKEQLASLEQDRRQIELLVRQASVKVFLEEKLRRLSVEIEDNVLSNHTLSDYLIQYESTKLKIAEIDGEIHNSGKADLISSIIGDLKPEDRKLFVTFFGLKLDISPVLQATEVIATNITKSLIR